MMLIFGNARLSLKVRDAPRCRSGPARFERLGMTSSSSTAVASALPAHPNYPNDPRRTVAACIPFSLVHSSIPDTRDIT